MNALVTVDPTNELSVSDYLTRARDWLATAVERTGPEQIAAAKAEIATAAEATKQLGLSKEIQLDAQEMVRRAEYALGKAIRKGQAEGSVTTRSDNASTRTVIIGRRGVVPDQLPDKQSPSDFASKTELFGNGVKPGIYAMADAGEENFDAAIDEAKAEGNLSRANVARKAREKSGAAPRPVDNDDRVAEAEVFNSLMRFVRKAITPERTANLKPRARTALINTFQHAIEVLTQKEEVA